MKGVLLDENLPVALRHHLAELDVVTVQFIGWSGKQNGELMGLMAGEFDVFLTGDKNVRHQQNIAARQLAIVELPFTRLGALMKILDEIRSAIREAGAGGYVRIGE